MAQPLGLLINLRLHRQHGTGLLELAQAMKEHPTALARTGPASLERPGPGTCGCFPSGSTRWSGSGLEPPTSASQPGSLTRGIPENPGLPWPMLWPLQAAHHGRKVFSHSPMQSRTYPKIGLTGLTSRPGLHKWAMLWLRPDIRLCESSLCNWLRYKKRNLLKSALSAYDKRLIQKLL